MIPLAPDLATMARVQKEVNKIQHHVEEVNQKRNLKHCYGLHVDSRCVSVSVMQRKSDLLRDYEPK